MKNRKGIAEKTLGYPVVNSSKLGKLYLSQEMYKTLYDVHGRSFISQKVYRLFFNIASDIEQKRNENYIIKTSMTILHKSNLCNIVMDFFII